MTNKIYQDSILPLFSADKIVVLEYFQQKGIIKRYYKCIHCEVEMTSVKYLRNNDGYAFRCMNKICVIGYKKYYSIRLGSFLDEFTISLPNCILILWKWMNGCTQENILGEVTVSKVTLIKFIARLRDRCELYFIVNPMRLGGDGIVCQVDESLFRHKPKYHVGRCTNREIWVFGIADTTFTPAKVFLSIVENRKSSTLIPIIESICRPGTIIHSDQWSSYRSLSNNIRFTHHTVNHSRNFVDPIYGIHTQNIESYWNKVKLRIKNSKGCYGENLRSFLFECMYKDNICKLNWDKVLELIKIG